MHARKNARESRDSPEGAGPEQQQQQQPPRVRNGLRLDQQETGIHKEQPVRGILPARPSHKPPLDGSFLAAVPNVEDAGGIRGLSVALPCLDGRRGSSSVVGFFLLLRRPRDEKLTLRRMVSPRAALLFFLPLPPIFRLCLHQEHEQGRQQQGIGDDSKDFQEAVRGPAQGKLRVPYGARSLASPADVSVAGSGQRPSRQRHRETHPSAARGNHQRAAAGWKRQGSRVSEWSHHREQQ
mmetsp:Transcript_55100/g.112514  ORF Transcript_55100/g.112514 Transcript_55100/m.112514 type:complete len:238 (-) Transcript_55100:1598-2311(-)